MYFQANASAPVKTERGIESLYDRDEKPAIPKMYRDQRSPVRDDGDMDGSANPGSPSTDTKNFDPKLTAPYQNDDDYTERDSKRNIERYRDRSNSAERKPPSRDLSKERRYENRGRSPARSYSPRRKSPPKHEDISPANSIHRSRSPQERNRSPSSRDRSPYARVKSSPRDRSHSGNRSSPRSPSYFGRGRSPSFNRFQDKTKTSPKDIGDEIQEEMRRQKRRAEEERRREERRKRHQRREENERREAEERKRREEYVFIWVLLSSVLSLLHRYFYYVDRKNQSSNKFLLITFDFNFKCCFVCLLTFC